MQISIVITCFNKAGYVADSVASALRQRAHEVIVVDDKSNDGSLRILEQIEGIELISNDRNCGVSHATIVGVNRAAEGGADFVITLDGDDCLAPNALEYYRDVLKKTNADAVYTRAVRDEKKDMHKSAKHCDVSAVVTIVDDPKTAYLQHMPASTALCAKPTDIVRYMTKEARVQDHQMALSIHFSAQRVVRSEAATHYCGTVSESNNLSSNIPVKLISSLVVYDHVYPIIRDHPKFSIYQLRILNRCMRLRHYGLLPQLISVGFRLLTPFRRLLPQTVAHRTILWSRKQVSPPSGG